MVMTPPCNAATRLPSRQYGARKFHPFPPRLGGFCVTLRGMSHCVVVVVVAVC
jgi:hypothetical protein